VSLLTSDDEVVRLERAVSQNTADLDLRIALGLALVDQGRLPAARAVFRSVLAQEPGRFGAVLGLSKAARAAGDYETALGLAHKASRIDASELGVQLDAAFDLIRLGRLSEAEAALGGLAQRLPEPSGAIIGLGHVARLRGDRHLALSHFLSALKRCPDRIEAMLEAAAEHLELGDIDAARGLLETALAFDAENLQALIAIGRMVLNGEGHAAALPWFERASAAHPTSCAAAVALAEIKHGLGETQIADQVLAGVLASDPESLEAHLLLAEFAWQAQDYERCLELSLKAAHAHPTHSAPPLQATRALMEMGRAEEALALLEPLCAAGSSGSDIHARKAEILMSAGRWAEAEAVLSTPDTGGTRFISAVQSTRLLLILGRLDEAQAVLDRFPMGSRWEKGFLGVLAGEIAEARWDHKGARAAYEAALDEDPNSANAHAALNRVCLLLADLEACRHHGAEALRLHAGVLKRRGQSSNPTSTHVGQIWDEFRMDATLANELRALLDLGPDARIAPLLAIARDAPDHTPTAMMLMIALRQSGRFQSARRRLRQGDADHGSLIPRDIIQYWDEPDAPDDIEAMMASWRTHNPDMRHQRFDLNSGGRFIQDHYPREAVTAYARAPSPAQKADVFRLSFLGAQGGLYADADDRGLQPVRPLLSQDASLVAWLEPFGTLGNNFIAAAPGNPVILRAQRLAAEAMNRHDKDIPWLSTGPGLLTRAFAQILSEADDYQTVLQDCLIVDRHETAPFALFHQFAAYKRTAKHWLRGAFGARDREES